MVDKIVQTEVLLVGCIAFVKLAMGEITVKINVLMKIVSVVLRLIKQNIKLLTVQNALVVMKSLIMNFVKFRENLILHQIVLKVLVLIPKAV